jgi:phage-related protein
VGKGGELMATAQELLIRVLGDGKQFRSDLAEDQREVNRLYDSMSGIHDVLATVRVDDEESRTRLEELQHDLDSIRDRTARVDINTEEGREELTQIRADLADLRDRTVDIHVDDAEAILAINNVRAGLDSLHSETINVDVNENRNQNSGGMEPGEGMGALGSLIMTALPLASPLAASAVGGVMALASAFTAAGAGAVGFGAVAVPNIKSVMDATSNLKKAQQEYNLATNDKQRAAALEKEKQAMQGLDGAQQGAVKSLQSFESFWSGFTKSFESPVLTLFSDGLNALQTILTNLKPAISSVATTLVQLSQSFQQSLGTDQVQSFFKFLGEYAGPTLFTFGKSAGNILLGLMNLLTDFAPLGLQMSAGLEQMTESFASWSEGVGKTKGFKDFISYVQENGPKIVSVLGNVGKTLINLLTDIAPVGAKLLDIVDSLSKFLNKFTEAHPKIVETAAATVASVGAFNLLKAGLTGALGSVNGFFDGFKEIKSAVTDTIGNIKGGIDGVKKFGAAFKDGGSINTFVRNVGSAGKSALTMGKNAIVATGNVIKSFATMVASAVANTAKMIAQWTILAARSTANAAKVAASWAVSAGKAMAKAVADTVVAVAKMVAQWVVIAAQSTANAVKVAASWTLSTGAAMAKAAADMAVTAAQFVAKWVMMGVQSMIQAARVAASWIVAMGPIGWVIAAVVGLVALIIANWSTVKKWTLEIWGAVSGFISGVWNSIKSAVSSGISSVISAASNMVSNIGHFFSGLPGMALKWGENMIDGFISGIKNMAGKVGNAVSGVISAAKKFIGFNSPSEEGEGQHIVEWGENMIGGFIDGIQNAAPKLKDVMSNVIASPKLAVSTSVGNMITGNSSNVGNGTSQNASGQASNSYTQQGPLLHIENFSVRNDQDINKLQRMLFNTHESVVRGMGKRL